MSKFSITLADPEEVIVVESDARDRRAFEIQGRKQFNYTGPILEIARAMPETYTVWLGWHACKRNGYSYTWEEFNKRVLEITDETDGEPDETPTKAGPTPA